MANAGAFTGVLSLKIGDPDTLLPKSGEVVWGGPGTTKLKFLVADAITDLDVWYTEPADSTSLLDRTLGQQDEN